MSEPGPVHKFVGAGLLAAGGLMAALCGACSVVFLGGSVISVFQYPRAFVEAALMLGIVAVVGGPPTLLGIWVARRGWRLLHPAKPSRAQIATLSDPPGPGDVP